ncbi:hypothetical protein ZIOFF_008199 [Zingiber officinale]|uniref:THH1/TOM1/TOM3 domain-containing protein n=1 Tax=Zingiber officinale TaxID=94328 RepID=A0A8J5M6G4_ZINOF|nr:hypothetical protein ZIOFF_008199 [Zingiber officinale]
MDSRPLIRGLLDSPGEAEAATSVASSVLEVAAIALNRASSWWNGAETPVLLQDWIFRTLAVLYGIVAAVALVIFQPSCISLSRSSAGIQLIRIECRVPDFGWTTQKVFHFLNFLVNGVRSVVFVLRRGVQHIRPEVFQHVVLDLPSLAFFTTYALLVLFWAEIYYQARAVSTDRLRPTFYTINAVLYTIQVFDYL